ncbi:hypothetical protein DYB26_005361 [Aphanomyces astaci]|uniref:Uncharacterized protein n=1 Tax=Aphanomyces astaci TaxID=112090 RepID=A0A3R6XBE8_APHAT|nr:hypothetical protein DYB34_004847 [Aphanomyces astaci]RHZ08500.1 hypothetical protein DYB26_005361 [Aphanomyces astaci]
MHSNAIATPQDLYDVDEFGDSPPSVVAVEVAAHTALDESYGDNDFAESAGAELVTTPTTIGTQLALANTVEDSYNDDQDFASVVAGDDDEGQVEDIPPTSTVDRESSAASNAVEASSKLLSTHAQDNAQSTNDVIQSEVMQVIAELTNHHLESNVVVVEAANEDMSCSGVPESKKEDVQLLEPAISQVTEPADVFGVELETSSDAPESEEPRASHVLTEKEPPIEAVESASNFKPTVQEPLSTFEPPSTVDLDQVNVLTAPPPDVQPLKEALSKQTIDETMVPSTSNDSEVSVVPVVVVDATSNDSEAPAVVLPVVEQSPNDDVETTNEATGDDNAHDVETTATDVSTINSIRSECAETPLTPTEVLPLLSIDTQVVASAAATPILQTEGYPSDSTTSFRDPNITVHSDSSSSTAALSPPQGTTEQVSTTILDIEVTPKDEIVSTSFDVIGQSNENTTGETEPSFGHGLGQMNESTTGEAESSSTVIESAPTIPVKYSDAVDDVPAHEDATPVVEADSEAEFAHGAAPQQPQEFLQLVTTNALSPNAPLDSASSLPTGRSVEQNPPGPERSSSNPDTLYDYDADEVADTSAARLSIATSDETTTLSPRTNSETVEDDYMAYAQTSVFDDDAYMSGGEAPTKLSATPSGNDIYKNVDAATEVEDNTAAPLVQDTGDDLSQLLQPGTDAEPSSNTFDVPIKKQDDCKEEAPSVERTGDQGAKQVDGESSSQCIVLPLVGKKESKLKTRLPPKQAQLQPTPIPPKPRPPPQPRKPEPKAPSSDSSSPMASDFVIHSSTSPPLDASGGGMVFHSPQKDYRPWRQQEVKPQMSPPKPRVAPKKKKAGIIYLFMHSMQIL